MICILGWCAHSDVLIVDEARVVVSDPNRDHTFARHLLPIVLGHHTFLLARLVRGGLPAFLRLLLLELGPEVVPRQLNVGWIDLHEGVLDRGARIVMVVLDVDDRRRSAAIQLCPVLRYLLLIHLLSWPLRQRRRAIVGRAVHALPAAVRRSLRLPGHLRTGGLHRLQLLGMQHGCSGVAPPVGPVGQALPQRLWLGDFLFELLL